MSLDYKRKIKEELCVGNPYNMHLQSGVLNRYSQLIIFPGNVNICTTLLVNIFLFIDQNFQPA